MHQLTHISFKDVASLSQNRSIVLFGASTIAEKTIRKLSVKPAYMVDNNPNRWGTIELGLGVKNPDVLRGQESILVLICTTSITEVSDQLSSLGFHAGVDFVTSPILNDLLIISEMESIRRSLLFTSGSPKVDHPLYGGGLYKLTIDGDEWSHRKVYDGICYGVIELNDHYILVDDHQGIVVLDHGFKVMQSTNLEPGTRGHGIAFSEKYQEFYIAASYRDAVLIFDNNFRYKKSINLSDKFNRLGYPCHHCNDLCVVEDSLYVSMFSATGNFRRDVFDGTVLEFDLSDHTLVGAPINQLWMPHNISFIDGSLTLLDSLRGDLLCNNAQKIGQFPGFTRGLAYDGSHYYVGQSRNRNFSKCMGLSLNISIDTSIIVFDEQTKVSRSLSLPPKLSEIHSILLI